MSRLPTPGGDDGAWGQLLNDFLSESHSSDGTLKDGVVSSGKLADGAVTPNKIADNAVTGAKIVDGAIATAKLADGAVTAVKITDATITGAKLANSTIGTTKLDSTVNGHLTSASTAVQTINGQSGTSITLPIAAPTVTRTYTSGAYPARNTTGVVIWIGPTAPTFGASAAADGDMWINNS